MTKPTIVQNKYIWRIHRFCFNSVFIDGLSRLVCSEQCSFKRRLDKNVIVYDLNVIDGAMVVNLIIVIFLGYENCDEIQSTILHCNFGWLRST